MKPTLERGPSPWAEPPTANRLLRLAQPSRWRRLVDDAKVKRGRPGRTPFLGDFIPEPRQGEKSLLGPPKPSIKRWKFLGAASHPFAFGDPTKPKVPSPVCSPAKRLEPSGRWNFGGDNPVRGLVGLVPPQRRRHAWANHKCRPGTPPVNGWEVRVLSKHFSHRQISA